MGAFAWFDRTRGRHRAGLRRRLQKSLSTTASMALGLPSPQEIRHCSHCLVVVSTRSRRRWAIRVSGLSDASTRTFRRNPASMASSYAGTRPEFAGTRDPRHAIRVAGPCWRSAKMSLQEFIEQLRLTFTDSVRIRLHRDVPVGVLLMRASILPRSLPYRSHWWDTTWRHGCCPRSATTRDSMNRLTSHPWASPAAAGAQDQLAHRAGPAAERIERANWYQRRTPLQGCRHSRTAS